MVLMPCGLYSSAGGGGGKGEGSMQGLQHVAPARAEMLCPWLSGRLRVRSKSKPAAWMWPAGSAHAALPRTRVGHRLQAGNVPSGQAGQGERL